MALNENHKQMLAALAAATEHRFDPTPGCPQGRSDWHSARRLIGWGLLPEGTSEARIVKLGEQLTGRGLAARKTIYGVTRFALTEAGLAHARHLARPAGAR